MMVVALDSPSVTVNQGLIVPELIVPLPEHTEQVNGELIEKTGMTFQHSLAQANLSSLWRSYAIASGGGGKVVTEAPCCTINRQIRRPDVAYITQEKLTELGKFSVLPYSFPLVGEIISPDDSAETVFAKTREYLGVGCQEVWLLFPENLLVMVITEAQWLVFRDGAQVHTQIMLPGFSVAVGELFV